MIKKTILFLCKLPVLVVIGVFFVIVGISTMCLLLLEMLLDGLKWVLIIIEGRIKLWLKKVILSTIQNV